MAVTVARMPPGPGPSLVTSHVVTHDERCAGGLHPMLRVSARPEPKGPYSRRATGSHGAARPALRLIVLWLPVWPASVTVTVAS